MNKFMKNIAVVYAFVSLFLIVWCAIHNDPQGVLCFMMSFTSLSFAICINHELDVTKKTLAEVIDEVVNIAEVLKAKLEHDLAELQKDIADD